MEDPDISVAGKFVYRPTDNSIKASNIHRFMVRNSILDYEELIKRSSGDIEWFWDAVVKDLGISWYVPYKQVMDASRGIPWTRWFLDGKINIAQNCVDRHRNLLGDSPACIWQDEEGSQRRITYGDLLSSSNQLANALRHLGIGKGDVVALYMPMIPEVLTALMGILKVGAIFVPIFSGYAAAALASRLDNTDAKAIITTDGYHRKGNLTDTKKEIDEVFPKIPSLKHCIIYKHLGNTVQWYPEHDLWWDDLIHGQSTDFLTEQMDSEDPAMMLHTSGTTGTPKATVHTHAGALVQCTKEVAYYFDVKSHTSVFWVTDIGWMMGPWEIIGTLALGGTVCLMEGAIDYPKRDRLWMFIEEHGVNVFGISPTGIRALMTYGSSLLEAWDLSSLKILGSTGEPWDAKSWLWYFKNVGRSSCPIINISGGTELFGCLVSPLPIMALKPCTVGGPGLGMAVDILDEHGNSIKEKVGYLVCRKPFPSMTRGFWKDPDRYIATYWSKWDNIWFHGDWATIDADGQWFLQGRTDDVIKIAGRRLGPAEIESILISDRRVSEAVAVGLPDVTKGEKLTCLVVLVDAVQPDVTLESELKARVANMIGKTFTPDDIRFVKRLPKNRAGKITRSMIKMKLSGKAIQDVSSLDNPDVLDEI
ncbi:MAG: AMP-binding protein [Thaumarchaeota archaeon]|nr:AMP-binding protein [Nitrososphaerota archaeon]